MPGAGACPGGLRAGWGQDPNPLAGGVSVHDSGDINLIFLIGTCVPLRLALERRRFRERGSHALRVMSYMSLGICSSFSDKEALLPADGRT